MPVSLPHMRTWLRAVRYAGNKAGPDFAQWAAKHVLQIPVNGIGAFLENIADWVRAGHGDGGHQFIVRPFSPDMSVRTVMKLSAEWHEAVASRLDGPQHAFPAALDRGGQGRWAGYRSDRQQCRSISRRRRHASLRRHLLQRRHGRGILRLQHSPRRGAHSDGRVSLQRGPAGAPPTNSWSVQHRGTPARSRQRCDVGFVLRRSPHDQAPTPSELAWPAERAARLHNRHYCWGAHMSMTSAADILRSAGITTKSTAPGRYYATCPQCSPKRKPAHQKLECLGITIDEKGVAWGCNHCNWKGRRLL